LHNEHAENGINGEHEQGKLGLKMTRTDMKNISRSGSVTSFSNVPVIELLIAAMSLNMSEMILPTCCGRNRSRQHQGMGIEVVAHVARDEEIKIAVTSP